MLQTESMCQRMRPRLKYACGHEVEPYPYIVQCNEAKERGSDCANPKDNYSLGMSSKKGKCPDCEGERTSSRMLQPCCGIGQSNTHPVLRPVKPQFSLPRREAKKVNGHTGSGSVIERHSPDPISTRPTNAPQLLMFPRAL